MTIILPDKYTGFWYFSTVRNKLKVMAPEKNLGSRVASKISSFEIATQVSEIHDQCLLNTSQLVNWGTIDKIEGQVRSNIA